MILSLPELDDVFVKILFPLVGIITVTAFADSDVVIDANDPFPRQLSEFRLFVDAEKQIPNEGLIPYDVITPLFSDYSEKYRFVYVPDGTSIEFQADGTLAFPIGAALIKTFAYPELSGDGLDLVETRVMINRASGWDGAAYAWNEEETEAHLAIAGKRVPVSWRAPGGNERSTTYFVPNMNQCKQCHRRGEVVEPLGFKARHINRDASLDGDSRNQLEYLSAIGVLSGLSDPSAIVRTPKWDDQSVELDARVRAYLDMNCAHCHNPNGLGSHTDLDLSYAQTNPVHRGIMKRPTSAGRASMDLYFAIKPGDPDSSFLLQRMLSTEAAVRMPQIMRTVVHEEGVTLIRDWIRSLD